MKIDNGKKKIIIKYLGIVVLYILACVFWLKSGILDTCFFYNSVDKGRWEYGYNAVMRKAFVGIYRWDGNTENIEELNNTFSKEYYLQYTDGEYDDVLYKVEYYYECPKRNKTFYSKNGKLYYKSNNKLAIKN